MKISVHALMDPAKPIAEAEVFARMAVAAARLGWECQRTADTREIEAFRPDIVLAEHFFVPKLTAFPTLGLMWSPADYWIGDDGWRRNVVSYDGHLFADAATERQVGDLVAPIPVQFVRGRWLPTCQATVLADGPRADLAYLGTAWDPERHRAVIAAIAARCTLHRHGPGSPGRDGGTGGSTLPFDGTGVIAALSGRAAALCFHAPPHRRAGTPSARVFEAAAAGAIIISDDNAFVRENFGDAALYVDIAAPPAAVAQAVAQHLDWIERHPAEAARMRVEAHRIFLERFSFETLLRGLPALRDEIVRAWAPRPAVAGHAVSYVVRAGGRPPAFLDRALASLGRQTHANLQAIVVAYRNADAVRAQVAAHPAAPARVRVIEAADTGWRSSALWAGLAAVDTPFFAVLDDDDTLMPNHVAAALATLDAYPEIDLAYSGTIAVREDADAAVPRRIASFAPFDRAAFRRRNTIYSNAWIARSKLLGSAGADPALAAGEDYHLLLCLMRAAQFAPTWRLTAEYRLRSNDPSHSPLGDVLAESLRRIERRQMFAPVPSAAPIADATGAVMTAHDHDVAHVLRRLVRRRHLRKGLAVYLCEIRRLPGRLARLPGLLRIEGLKGLRWRIAARGAAAYAESRRRAISRDR